MKNLLSTLLILQTFFSYSQKETYHRIGTGGLHFDYNSKPVKIQRDIPNLNNSLSATAISDNEGHLLFYTDGSSIWYPDGSIVTNAEDIGGVNTMSQNTLICPVPYSNRYYIFGCDYTETNVFSAMSGGKNGPENNNNIHYTLLEVQEDKTVHILEKNVKFGKSIICDMDVTLDDTGENLWLITSDDSSDLKLVSYKFTACGLTDTVINPLTKKDQELYNVYSPNFSPTRLLLNGKGNLLHLQKHIYSFNKKNGEITFDYLGINEVYYIFYLWINDSTISYQGDNYIVTNTTKTKKCKTKLSTNGYTFFFQTANYVVQKNPDETVYFTIYTADDEFKLVSFNIRDLTCGQNTEEKTVYTFEKNKYGRVFRPAKYPSYIQPDNNYVIPHYAAHTLTVNNNICIGDSLKVSIELDQRATINYYVLEKDTLHTSEKVIKYLTKTSGKNTGYINISYGCMTQNIPFDYNTFTAIEEPNIKDYYIINSCDSSEISFTIDDENIQKTLWSNGVNTNTTTLNKGEHFVTLSNSCESIEKHFTIEEIVKMIPNIITPNNDGKNDIFTINHLANKHQLTISNRWGQTMIDTDNYQNNWPNNEIHDGTYFYELNNDSCYSKGWIQVVK